MAELNPAKSQISTLINDPQATNVSIAEAKKSLDDYINTIVNNLGPSICTSQNIETHTVDTPIVDDQDMQDSDTLSEPDLQTNRSSRKKRRYKSSLETISELDPKPQEIEDLSEYSCNSDTADNESISDCSSRLSVINNNDRNTFLSSNYKLGYDPSPSLVAMNSLSSLSHEPVPSSLPKCVSEQTSSVQMIYHTHEWEVEDDYDRLLSETSLKLSSPTPSFKPGTSVAVSSKSGLHIVGIPSPPIQEFNNKPSIGLLTKNHKTENSIVVEDKRKTVDSITGYEKKAIGRNVNRKLLLPSTHENHDQQTASSYLDNIQATNEEAGILIIRKASTVDIHSTQDDVDISEKNLKSNAITEIRRDDEAENCNEVTRDIDVPSKLVGKRLEITQGKNAEEDLINPTNTTNVTSNLFVDKAPVSLPDKIQELNRFSKKESIQDTHRTYSTKEFIRDEKDGLNILAQSTEFLMTPIQLSNSSIEDPSSECVFNAYKIQQTTGLEEVREKLRGFKSLIIEKKTLGKSVKSSRPNTPGDLISFDESPNAKLKKSSSNEKSRQGSVLNLMDAEIEELQSYVPTPTTIHRVDEIVDDAVPQRLIRGRGPRTKFAHGEDNLLDRDRVGDMYLQTVPLVPTPYTRDVSSHATRRATGDVLRSQENLINTTTEDMAVSVVNTDSLLERREESVGHSDHRSDEILESSQIHVSQPRIEIDGYDPETVVTSDGTTGGKSLDVKNVRYIRKVQPSPPKVQKNSRGYSSSTDTSYSSCSSVREKHKYNIYSNELANSNNTSAKVNTRKVRSTSSSHLKENKLQNCERNENISEKSSPCVKNKLAKFSVQLEELKACVQDSNKYLERCLARGKSSHKIKMSERKHSVKCKKAASSSSTDAELYNIISSSISRKAIKCTSDNVKRVEPSVGRLTSSNKRISTNKEHVNTTAKIHVGTKRMKTPMSLFKEKELVNKTVGELVESARASPAPSAEKDPAMRIKYKSKAHEQLIPTKDNTCGSNKKIEKKMFKTGRSIVASYVGSSSASTKKPIAPSTLKTSKMNHRCVTKNDVQTWVTQSKKYSKSKGNDFGDGLKKDFKSKSTRDRPQSDTKKKSRKTLTRTSDQDNTVPGKGVSLLKTNKGKQNSETLSDEPNTTESSECESQSHALPVNSKHYSSEEVLDALAGTVKHGLQMRNIKRSSTGRNNNLDKEPNITPINATNSIVHQLKSDTHHLLPVEAKSGISQTISKIVDSISDIVDTSIDKRVCWDSSTDIVPGTNSDTNIKRSVTSEKIIETGSSVLQLMTKTLIKKIKRRSKKSYHDPIVSLDSDVETEVSFNSKCEMKDLSSDSVFSHKSSVENISKSVEHLSSICSDPLQYESDVNEGSTLGLMQSKSGSPRRPADKEVSREIISNVKVPSKHAIAALEDLEALLEGIGGPKKPNIYCQRRIPRRRMKSPRVKSLTPLAPKTLTRVETPITPLKQKEEEIVKREIMGDATILTTARLPTKQIPTRPFTNPSVSNKSSCARLLTSSASSNLSASSSFSSIDHSKDISTADFDTSFSSAEEKSASSNPPWPYGRSSVPSETSSTDSLIANHSSGLNNWLNGKDSTQITSYSRCSMSHKYDSDDHFSLDSNTFSRCSTRISQLALPNQRRVMQTKSDFQHVLKKPFIDRLDKIIKFKGRKVSSSISSVSTSTRDWRTTWEIPPSRPPSRRKETTSTTNSATNIEMKSSIEILDDTSNRSPQIINTEIQRPEFEIASGTAFDVRQEYQSEPNFKNIEVRDMVLLGTNDQSITQQRSLSSIFARIPRCISNITTSYNPKTRAFKSRNYIKIDLDTWNAFTNNCIANFQKTENALILGGDNVMDTFETSFTATRTLSITSSQASDDLSFRTAGTHFSNSIENISSTDSFEQLGGVHFQSCRNKHMLALTNETQDGIIVDTAPIINQEKTESVCCTFSSSNENLSATESLGQLNEIKIKTPSSQQMCAITNETRDELVDAASIGKQAKPKPLYCSEVSLIGLLGTLATRKQRASDSETCSSSSESDLSEEETMPKKRYRAKDTLNDEITLPLPEDCSSSTLLDTVKQLLTTDSESSLSEESSDDGYSDLDSDEENNSNSDVDSNEEGDYSEEHDVDGHTRRKSKLTPMPRETLTDVLQTIAEIFNKKRAITTGNVIIKDVVKADSTTSCQQEIQSKDESCDKTHVTEALPLASATSNNQEDTPTGNVILSKITEQVEFEEVKQPLLYAEVSCSAPMCYLLERYDTSVQRGDDETLVNNPVGSNIFVNSPSNLPTTTSCQYLSERFVPGVSLPVVDIISSESFQNILSVLTHMPRQQSVDKHESPVRYTNYLRSFSDQNSELYTEINKEQRFFNDACSSTSLVTSPARAHEREEECIPLQMQSSSSISFDNEDILEEEVDELSMLEAPEVISSGGGGDSTFRDLPDDLGLGWLLDEDSFSDVQVGVAHHTSSASVEVTDSVADATLLSASSSSDSQESVIDNRLFNSARSLASLTSSYRHQSQDFDCAIYALLLEQYSMRSQLEAISAKLDSEILAEDVLCNLNSEEAAPIKAKSKITKILFFIVSVMVFVALIYGTRYPPVCQ